MPSAAHSFDSTPRGIGEHVIGVDHRRRAAEPVGLALEELGLPLEPEILERGALALAQIGSDHPLGLADQEGVGEAGEIVIADRPDHVVPHMLLVPDRRGRPAASPRSVAITLAPVAIHRRDHLVAHRMIGAAGLEEAAVERLVGDEGVGAAAEAAHHRRGEVARPRPHGDAEWSRPLLLRDVALDALGVELLQPLDHRAAAGRAARPSTSRTGTMPAKVPVTNASSAP